MKSSKHTLALLIFTLAIVAGYLPYRLGYWNSDSLPVRAMNTVYSVFLGENRVDHIRITEHTAKTITVGMDVHYNGAYGRQSVVQVALITTRHGHDHVYARGRLTARRGDQSGQAVIYRPPMDMYAVTLDKVRVAFSNGGAVPGQDAEVFQLTDVNYTLPSRVNDTQDRTPGFWKLRIAELITAGQYEILDRLLDDWNKPDAVDIDGKARLDILEEINPFLSYSYRWDDLLSIIRKGRQEYPDSAALAVIEAGFWIHYAWDARGTGYAGSITNTGKQLFNERLDKAEQVLRESRSYASGSPVWYQHYLTVAMARGWSNADILSLFIEGITRHPTSYQIYFNTAYALSPKWGGSMELMDLIARSADKLVPAPEKDVIYARVYWSISEVLSENEDLFHDSHVDWARMKAGFSRLLDEYPDSDWNLNNFGRFACSAGDNKTYQEVRARIGSNRVVQDVWKGNTSLEACDRTLLART